MDCKLSKDHGVFAKIETSVLMPKDFKQDARVVNGSMKGLVPQVNTRLRRMVVPRYGRTGIRWQ